MRKIMLYENCVGFICKSETDVLEFNNLYLPSKYKRVFILFYENNIIEDNYFNFHKINYDSEWNLSVRLLSFTYNAVIYTICNNINISSNDIINCANEIKSEGLNKKNGILSYTKEYLIFNGFNNIVEDEFNESLIGKCLKGAISNETTIIKSLNEIIDTNSLNCLSIDIFWNKFINLNNISINTSNFTSVILDSATDVLTVKSYKDNNISVIMKTDENKEQFWNKYFTPSTVLCHEKYKIFII